MTFNWEHQTTRRGEVIRVLTLIEGSDATGGVGILIESAKRATASLDYGSPVEFTLVTYQRGAARSALAKAARNAGLDVRIIFERWRWDLSVIPQLRQIVAEQQPHIVESRNVKSHFLVRLLSLNRKYIWIAWHRGYTKKDWLDRTYNQLDRWSLRGAFRVVASCDVFARHLEGRGVQENRIIVLYNFVKRFVPPLGPEVEHLRRKLGMDGKPVIISVGRLSAEKGHSDLLRAAAMLRRAGGAPPFHIILVGDGPERQSLTRLAAGLGLAERLTITGFENEVDRYYSLATLMVLPSHSEGFPNVVLEAMAAGVPIVATAVGGIPELLHDGRTGLIVPPREPKMLAAAIVRLLTDAGLRIRLATAANSQVEQNRTLEVYIRELSLLYKQTLDAWNTSGPWGKLL